MDPEVKDQAPVEAAVPALEEMSPEDAAQLARLAIEAGLKEKLAAAEAEIAALKAGKAKSGWACACGSVVTIVNEIHRVNPTYTRLDAAHVQCVKCRREYLKVRENAAWTFHDWTSIAAHEALKKLQK